MRSWGFTYSVWNRNGLGFKISGFTSLLAALLILRTPWAISFCFSFLPTSLLILRTPWAISFCFSFLPTSLLFLRTPWAISFVARRKIWQKGVPKGSKAALWILAFLYGGLEGRRA